MPLAQPYRDLVWLAYLVLPVAIGEQRRLVLAHRLAAVAVSRLSRDPVRLRQTFLRRLLRTRIRPWSGRLAFVDVEPAVTRSAEADFTAALHRLSPQVRAAYVLLTLEERPADQVEEILTGAGVPDAQHVIYQVSRLEPLRRPAADPTLARMYGRPPVRPSRKMVVGALVCALAALVVIPRLDLSRAVSAAPLTAAPAPAPRGSLAHDRALIRRAMVAWHEAHLLYAGELDGARVVLLHSRSSVARYTEDGTKPTLEVFPEPDPTSPLKLRTTTAGNRYLLPLGVDAYATRTLSRSRWRKGTVRDGVTAPIRTLTSRGCWRGPVMRMTMNGRLSTMLDFGRLTMAHASANPIWNRLGCAVDRPSGEIREATAWEFWSGSLPEGVAARWVCLRLTEATGGNSITGILLTPTSTTVTATRTNTADCAGGDLAAATWWKGPSGKRHHVVAGTSRVTAITIRGDKVSAVNDRGERVAVLR